MSDINKPVSDSEVDQFIAGLNETDRAELRRQQLQHKAVTREAEKPVDWANLTEAQFIAEKRKLGIG